jgi:hypothetical protein
VPRPGRRRGARGRRRLVGRVGGGGARAGGRAAPGRRSGGAGAPAAPGAPRSRRRRAQAWMDGLVRDDDLGAMERNGIGLPCLCTTRQKGGPLPILTRATDQADDCKFVESRSRFCRFGENRHFEISKNI